ncbi:hypothetical protein QCA50_007842 [Cerrena zonata]|uniref:Uncharacterized protein n=1 Tax=Cerrena zonata TaxID=2478898 RepID=A0AAW0G729_9APHY
MADPASSVPIDPFQLLGGLLALICISFALYGIGVAQAYVFMFNSKNDTIRLKLLVAIVFIAETLHSAFVLRLLYYYTLNVMSSFPAVSIIDWSVPVRTCRL